MKIYEFSYQANSTQTRVHTLSKREATRLRAEIKRDKDIEVEYLGEIFATK